ncbi:hypothetical protein CBM2586_A11187 [Cupriavidus phytorum]|uniref:HTH gntR-type domain-containing protein n=1 Tax=Cupriavidus taiwanensis TaxID=164546 RepID=A0A375BDH9_9BURK|nr:hypothetical protein CBM2586_A11187 [Cupriavidus taiwanensis]
MKDRPPHWLRTLPIFGKISRPIEINPSAMELHLALDHAGNLTAQIVHHIRDAIQGGRLEAGARMPPSRLLGTQLGVARKTVTTAYERLVAEGWLHARVGDGTYVAQGLAGPAVRIAVAPVLPPAVQRWLAVPTPFLAPAGGARYAFQPGQADTTRFPHEAWARCVRAALAAERTRAPGPADAAGEMPLRQAIARHIAFTRGVQSAPTDILVTSGAQQGIDLLARLLLGPGAVVAMEDPGYPMALVPGSWRAGRAGAGRRRRPGGGGAAQRRHPGLCHALAPVAAGRADEPGAAPGPARLGRAPPCGDPGGRLRQRVPLRRPGAGRAADARPARPRGLPRHVLQDPGGQPARRLLGGAAVADAGGAQGQAPDGLVHADAAAAGAGALPVRRPPAAPYPAFACAPCPAPRAPAGAAAGRPVAVAGAVACGGRLPSGGTAAGAGGHRGAGVDGAAGGPGTRHA